MAEKYNGSSNWATWYLSLCAFNIEPFYRATVDYVESTPGPLDEDDAKQWYQEVMGGVCPDDTCISAWGTEPGERESDIDWLEIAAQLEEERAQY